MSRPRTRSTTPSKSPAAAAVNAAAYATIPNPFRGTVVGNPWELGSAAHDVAEIHHDVFDKCLRTVEDVRHGHSSNGLIIHGSAGSGKTHLIGRLRRRLIDDQPAPALEHLSHAFAYVRLNTHAAMLARHVRRAVADDLLRTTGARPNQLERMVLTRLMEMTDGGGDIAQWRDFYCDEHREELARLVQELGERERLSDRFVQVLIALLGRQHRREVSAWLRGETLTEAGCAKLDLTPLDPDADPEFTAREALVDFMRLAGHKIPLVICFDQIEALQTSLDDTQGLFAYGQLLAELHDADANLVLISCLQTHRYQPLCDALPPFAKDRIRSGGAMTLDLLNPAQAELLIRLRLSQSAVATLRPAGASEVWPFTPDDVRRIVGKRGCTPRELLDAAARRFEQWQHPQTTFVPASPDEWFAEEWEQRESQAVESSQTANTAEILTHAVPHLVRVVEPQWQVARGAQPPDVDFVLQAPRQEARVGVMICEDHPIRLAARLKRVSAVPPQQSGLHKLVLLRDERNPIKKTARQTLEYLQKLETFDAVRCRVAPQTLAALDAMRSLLADAQSGDLARGAETIGPVTVLDWLRRNLADSLQELADVLVTPQGTTPGVDHVAPAADHSTYFPPLQEFLAEHCLAPWSDAAAAVGVTGRQAEELLSAVGARTDLFGVVPGEPAVVFAARRGSGGPG